MSSIIVLLALIGVISAGGTQQQDKRINYLEIGTIDQCEGSESANYTFVNPYSLNSNCQDFIDEPSHLIICSPNGEQKLVSLQVLAYSDNSAGAYWQYEVLYLCLSGPLAGKYAYIREIYLTEAYLKRCSSVLGQSLTSTKSLTLLITKKLNVNMFTSPGGAYDEIKKSSSTICRGGSYTVS